MNVYRRKHCEKINRIHKIDYSVFFLATIVSYDHKMNGTITIYRDVKEDTVYYKFRRKTVYINYI